MKEGRAGEDERAAGGHECGFAARSATAMPLYHFIEEPTIETAWLERLWTTAIRCQKRRSSRCRTTAFRLAVSPSSS